MLIDIQDIQFHKIISRHHALIWSGTYKNKQCAIKMFMLTSGIHYKKNKFYGNDGLEIRSSEGNKYFTDDLPRGRIPSSSEDLKPFKHSEFLNIAPKCRDYFLKTETNTRTMSDLGIGAHYYGYYIHESNIHYGFIVTELTDCSLKDVLLNRTLTSKEEKMIDDIIKKMHKKSKVIHGDLKPSNIGVYLENSGKFSEQNKITKCVLFDCSGVKQRDQCSSKKFKYLIKKDLQNYEEHVKKNKTDDRN